MEIPKAQLDLILSESIVPAGSMEDEAWRALFIAIFWRAVRDWVTYRTAGSLARRKVAAEAYMWIFMEQPGHWTWKIRQSEGMGAFAFTTMCDALNLDAGKLRRWAESITAEKVKNLGRQADSRKVPKDV